MQTHKTCHQQRHARNALRHRCITMSNTVGIVHAYRAAKKYMGDSVRAARMILCPARFPRMILRVENPIHIKTLSTKNTRA